jgi:hypothetical protein
MKLTRRKLQELKNKGVLRQELDGSITQVKDTPKAAPAVLPDNKKRSWKVDQFERDFEGYITSVIITETTR